MTRRVKTGWGPSIRWQISLRGERLSVTQRFVSAAVSTRHCE